MCEHNKIHLLRPHDVYRQAFMFCLYPLFLFFNFYKGVKSAKFCLDFRHQSPLTPYAFETEKRIGNLKLFFLERQ